PDSQPISHSTCHPRSTLFRLSEGELASRPPCWSPGPSLDYRVRFYSAPHCVIISPQITMKQGSLMMRQASRAAWLIAIVVVSVMVTMIFSWGAPGLGLYVRDRLMQARGPLTPPDDIVLIVIDETSIARYGRFPWQRGL